MTMKETLYPGGGSSGWSFYYQVVPGSGLVLRKVSNANYRLARDMRVTAVWVSAGDPADPANPPLKLRLGDQVTPAVTPPNGDLENPTSIMQVPSLPADFQYYRTLFGVSASFATPLPVLGPGSDLVSITQDYQFGPYGIDPPHEPGGVLKAARLLPLVSFKCKASGPASNHIRYIRIDYRFNYKLDVYSETPQLQTGLTDTPQVANQAAIFRDKERLPIPVGLGGLRIPKINDVFFAAEKPLQYEIVGTGLVRGNSVVGGVPATWDNIHQWPVSASGELPSTPGAFHTVHTHWRFGAVSGDPSSWAAYVGLIPGANPIPAAGPSFQGFNWTTKLGGPLVDHRIPDQTITFAVAADTDPPQDPDLDVSTQPFKNYFLNKNTPTNPRNVSAGSNLIQWFSIEVFRDPQDTGDSWEGTVFIHGLYFGHGLPPLKAEAQAAAGNLTSPLLKPTPNPVWERGPT